MTHACRLLLWPVTDSKERLRLLCACLASDLHHELIDSALSVDADPRSQSGASMIDSETPHAVFRQSADFSSSRESRSYHRERVPSQLSCADRDSDPISEASFGQGARANSTPSSIDTGSAPRSISRSTASNRAHSGLEVLDSPLRRTLCIDCVLQRLGWRGDLAESV